MFTFKIVCCLSTSAFLTFCTEVASALIIHPVVDASMILQMYPIYITFISLPILLIFSLCSSFASSQVLFFDDESKRAAFVNHLRPAVTDIGQEIRVKEMREEELLKEALTREQRAQIVETFIRHAFSKVLSAFTSSSALLQWQQL